MPLTELQKKLLGGFKATAIPGYVPIQPGGSPLEYAQLHDLPMDTTLWNNSMIREYTSWAKSQIPDPGAASFGPYEPASTPSRCRRGRWVWPGELRRGVYGPRRYDLLGETRGRGGVQLVGSERGGKYSRGLHLGRDVSITGDHRLF